jgi:ferredoxin--NADP+ reductase
VIHQPLTRTAHAIESVRYLTEFAFVVRLARNNFSFKAGQFVNVSFAGGDTTREYSIYSAENDPFLELLVRLVPDGFFTPRLHTATPGEVLWLDGPYDEHFTIPDASKSCLFVATGTGIAPFHSMIRSNPALRYRLVHGVRYDRECYPSPCYIGCLSKDEGGEFGGRVSDWLRNNRIDPLEQIYLCGNSEMIFEVTDILRRKEVLPERIFTEIFF